MEGFFTVGQVSNMFNISKQTLIFYDRKGLLSPSYRDDSNKYRYYSINDIELLDNIIFLRELGMSLQDIKKYLDCRTLYTSKKMFFEHMQKIDDKIKFLKNIRNKVNSTINDLCEADNYTQIPFTDICGSFNIVKYDIEKSDILNSSYLYFKKIVDLLAKKNIECTYKFGVITDINNLFKNEFLVKKAAICLLDDKKEGQYFHEISRGLYAICYHKGEYETISNSYKKLFNFIDENLYIVTGDSIEFCITDSFSENNEKNYITKILIPIKKTES